MAVFQPRTTKPEAGNKYYITKENGGYSDAIKGKPTDKDCDVLANCVGYAYGRFNEIGGYGYCKYLRPVNAENFIQYVKRNGVWVTTNGSDGSGDDSGDTGSSPSYTNLLPSAVDTDGTPYGDGKGYISGYKLSCSSAGGTPSATSGAYVSGFIPITDIYDKLRIKNVTLHANANVNNIIFYNKDKTKIRSVAGIEGGFAELVKVDDGNVYRAWPGSWLSDTTGENIGFFRFSCGGITDETIVTVNEEIV